MANYTAKRRNQIKEQVNILDVAKKHFDVIEKGNQYYLKDHDSCKLFAKTNSYFRFSTGTGGDAIHFLQNMCGYTFQEAFDELYEMVNPDLETKAHIEATAKPKKTQPNFDKYKSAFADCIFVRTFFNDFDYIDAEKGSEILKLPLSAIAEGSVVIDKGNLAYKVGVLREKGASEKKLLQEIKEDWVKIANLIPHPMTLQEIEEFNSNEEITQKMNEYCNSFTKKIEPISKEVTILGCCNITPDVHKHVYAYLTDTRCIDKKIVEDLMKQGLIMEEEVRTTGKGIEYHYFNAVFFTKDERGFINGANKRSASSMGKPFKGEVTGTTRNGYILDRNAEGMYYGYDSTKPLLVFEGYIDMLSYMSLMKDKGYNLDEYAYIATGGAGKWQGVADLIQQKGYTQVDIMFDNDAEKEQNVGMLDAQNFKEYLDKNVGEDIAMIHTCPKGDWNDYLVAKKLGDKNKDKKQDKAIPVK